MIRRSKGSNKLDFKTREECNKNTCFTSKTSIPNNKDEPAKENAISNRHKTKCSTWKTKVKNAHNQGSPKPNKSCGGRARCTQKGIDICRFYSPRELLFKTPREAPRRAFVLARFATQGSSTSKFL
jgi:hypothetical protein